MAVIIYFFIVMLVYCIDMWCISSCQIFSISEPVILYLLVKKLTLLISTKTFISFLSRVWLFIEARKL